MIICAKYEMNASRTVDATEQKRFFRSKLNDVEDIGQCQGSSNATHRLMLLIICTKYGKIPPWTVYATGQTRKVNGQTEGQTGWIQYTIPPNFVDGGIKSKCPYWRISQKFMCPGTWSACPSHVGTPNVKLWTGRLVVLVALSWLWCNPYH